MTTSTSHIADVVEGLVETTNERGIRVSGEWRNLSKFHPVDLPARGTRVRLELDGKGFIKACSNWKPRPPPARRQRRPCAIAPSPDWPF